MTNKAFSIFNQLRPVTVGFDNMFDHFERMVDDHNFNEMVAVKYPPYNIVKTGSYTYDIQLALAGYGKKDIDVSFEDSVLTVKSIKDEAEKEVEEELQFELKTSLPQSDINEIAATSEEVSPLSLTITELQKRAEDRRNKMKGFNYKFTDQLNKNIDDIERQPAYKRLGISLDDAGSTISKSKTSLATDDNEDIQLKSNNSFLHDNVD